MNIRRCIYLDNFVFHNPTKIYFGKDQIRNLENEIVKYGMNVLIVTGGCSVKESGLFDKVVSILNDKCNIYELSGVEPNPHLTTVKKGINICKENKIDVVLAIGGGSVIDASKAICAGAKYDGDVWDFYTRKKMIKEALPLGTILTLAATGSEMNGSSVISNKDAIEKRGTGSIYSYPKFSILDPTYTFTVPKEHTINGIVDIMAHVFEQYFSHTKNTPLQDQLCESVLRTVIDNANTVITKPDNYDARANILLSGTMALNGMIKMGMAGDWASHAIEHQLSAIYDIPHGGGLSIIYPNWMRYVLEDGVEKFKRYAIEVWDVEAKNKTDKEIALEGIEKTTNFFKEIGAPLDLKYYNIDDENIDIMSGMAVADGAIGSYKRLEYKDVKNILTMCL